MAISRELFLAILAMDAYNRGYNNGIGPENVGLGLVGSRLGNAIVDSIDGAATAQSASFFAISYTIDAGRSYASATAGGPALTAGTTVIAFRGTDQPDRDRVTGYGTGAGEPLSIQAGLALDFYRTVVQAGSQTPPTGEALRNANVTLTGHSLGGGLAGYVGGLYGLQGRLFDTMAFELAASRAHENALDLTILGRDDLDFPAARPANENHGVHEWSAA